MADGRVMNLLIPEHGLICTIERMRTLSPELHMTLGDMKLFVQNIECSFNRSRAGFNPWQQAEQIYSKCPAKLQ